MSAYSASVEIYEASLFDKNKAKNDEYGEALVINNEINLYSYNSVYTANEKGGVVKEQIRGMILEGDNLIEDGLIITRETVFGSNEFKDGFIKPLEFAKSAQRLTSIDIEAPEGILKDSILSWLEKDKIGNYRPDTGFVTFGAVEYDGIGIKESNYNIIVAPNITDKEFFIIFENDKEQKVSIELFDVVGRNILDIFNGIAKVGMQIFRVYEKLASGVYLVKVLIGDNVFVRKVIIEK